MQDPWTIDTFHITLRLVLALLLGGVIGFERERSSRAAGLRTHILVCLGSTLVMLLSMYASPILPGWTTCAWTRPAWRLK